MFTEKQKEKLKSNWGDKAECLECEALHKFIIHSGRWECYLLGMNPENEDEIYCIWNGYNLSAEKGFLNFIMNIYDERGDNPILDKSFRPRKASEIFKNLRDER